MNKVLRVGIAGYGSVGRIRHRYIDLHKNMKVAAICDQSFANNKPALPQVQCYSNYKELLKEKLDVLFVCLPNYLASEVTIAGLDKGLHVFCEKPPAKDLQGLINVIRCEKKHPRQVLMYGFNHRYHYSVKDALKVIKSGKLGKVISLRGVYGKSKIIRFDTDWRTKRALSGGGILLDQGIHMVDMMRLFAAEEFPEIRSFVTNSYWKHDVEDNAYAIMQTKSGVVAMLHSSATQWRHKFNLDIILTKGAILLSGILTSTRSYGAETITIVHSDENSNGDPKEEMTRYNEDVSWKEETFQFADVVLKKTAMVHGSSLEALKTMNTVYNIYAADSAWCKKYRIKTHIPEVERLIRR